MRLLRNFNTDQILEDIKGAFTFLGVLRVLCLCFFSFNPCLIRDTIEMFTCEKYDVGDFLHNNLGVGEVWLVRVEAE